MREALLELGIAGRIGVNTGEVVTGTEERLATGDAVAVAARLEQAAQPGEVLVGAETLRLVHAAVAVGDEQQQELKARRSPCRRIRCWRSRASCSRRPVSNGASRNGDGDSRLLDFQMVWRGGRSRCAEGDPRRSTIAALSGRMRLALPAGRSNSERCATLVRPRSPKTRLLGRKCRDESPANASSSPLSDAPLLTCDSAQTMRKG